MGYIRHDAIIATSWKAEHLELAWKRAHDLKLPIGPVVLSPLNSYGSFLIAPDGSKEGWADSDEGEQRREAWKTWMREQKEMWVDWAHVNFGGDDADQSSLKDHSGLEPGGTKPA